jgi:hypothetical protein
VKSVYTIGATILDDFRRAPRLPGATGYAARNGRVRAEFESRSIGGLGVYLIGQLVQSARYAHEGGYNRLWLTLPCKG